MRHRLPNNVVELRIQVEDFSAKYAIFEYSFTDELPVYACYFPFFLYVTIL